MVLESLNVLGKIVVVHGGSRREEEVIDAVQRHDDTETDALHSKAPEGKAMGTNELVSAPLMNDIDDSEI